MIDDDRFWSDAQRYLDGQLDGEALARFDAALVEEPARAEALLQLAARGPLLRLGRQRRPARRWLLAAALLLVGVGLGLLFTRPGPTPPEPGPELASSSPASPSSAAPVLLAGGRVRLLGPARYELLADDRLRLTSGQLEVRLEAGTATSSFVIETPAGRVSARRAHFLLAADGGPNDDGAPPMMTRTRVLVLAGLLTLTNPHGAIDGRAGMLLAGEPEAPPRELVQSTTDFSLELYKQLATRNQGNLTCSPYSVHAALAMLLEGARGETRAELAKAMRIPVKDGQPDHLSWASARLRAGLAKLRAELAASEGVELKIANRVVVDKRFPLRPELAKALGEHAAAIVADDLGDAAGVQQRVNRWAAEQTGGKISKALASPPAANTVMLLINALAFEGQWALPFDKHKTRDLAFTLASGDKVKVPMMFSKLDPTPRPDARQWRAARAQLGGQTVDVVEIPYRGGQLAMSLIIPPHGQLAAVEQGLSRAALDKAHASLGRGKLTLLLPRFKLTSDIELRPALEALGAGRLFRPGADLTGFADKADLWLGRAQQQAMLEIDEEGTRGAAVTTLPIRARSMPRRIAADRPFLALVRDRQSGAILFMARVADPR